MSMDDRRADAPLMARDGKVERLPVWRCIGCGKIEAPQPCIGVCQDRKVDLVLADDYDDLADRLELARQAARAAMALVRRLAWTTPRAA
jgi:hypothetical protein